MTHFKKKVRPSNHFTSQLGLSSLVDCPSILVHFGKFKLVFSVDNARILSSLMSRSFYDTIFYQNIKKFINVTIKKFINKISKNLLMSRSFYDTIFYQNIEKFINVTIKKFINKISKNLLMSRSFYDTIFYQNIEKPRNPKIVS